MSPGPRTLVACLGNVFLGDDGFGVAVARHLTTRPLGDDVRVAEFGIRSMDLAFAILEGYERVILVDAVRRGGPPGTLYVLEPSVAPSDAAVTPHALDPAQILALVERLGGTPPSLAVVGCEPAAIPDDDAISVGLSPAVAAAVAPASVLVSDLVRRGGVPHHA